MPGQQSKKPLARTAYILGAAIIIIASMGLADNGGTIAFIAQLILFPIGLAIGLAFSIAVMVGIFFAAASMSDKKAAAELWGALKNRWSCLSC